MIRCGTSPLNAEFTLCGDAFDQGDSGDEPANPVFASPGQIIDCPSCRAVIVYCKGVKNWKEPPDDRREDTRSAFID